MNFQWWSLQQNGSNLLLYGAWGWTTWVGGLSGLFSIDDQTRGRVSFPWWSTGHKSVCDRFPWIHAVKIVGYFFSVVLSCLHFIEIWWIANYRNCLHTFTSTLHTNHVKKKVRLSFNLVIECDTRETGLGYSYSYSVHVWGKGLPLRSCTSPYISGIFFWCLQLVLLISMVQYNPSFPKKLIVLFASNGYTPVLYDLEERRTILMA